MIELLILQMLKLIKVFNLLGALSLLLKTF
nr:MAG TPA: hypothetical protein [Crassvirales sp.]